MKKLIIFFIGIALFGNIIHVNAVCSDKEINDLVEKFSITYTDDTSEKIISKSGHVTEFEGEYAYFLVFEPYSDKLKIEVTNQLDNDKQFAFYNKTLKTFVVGSGIHFKEKEYKISVYGNESSTCSGELLKTAKYTVPRYNKYSSYAYCANHKDEDICTLMKDTSKISIEEFEKIVAEKEEESANSNISIIQILRKNSLKYSLFALCPIFVISIYYCIKIIRYRKKVDNQ